MLHRVGFVEGYDLKDGRRVWWIKANTTGTSTVATAGDTIYVATWSPIGEADQLPALPAFATLLKQIDKDGNGQISQSELPPRWTSSAGRMRPTSPVRPCRCHGCSRTWTRTKTAW